MNNIDISSEVPIVKIGIIQSTTEVELKCDGDFNLVNREDEIQYKGNAGQIYRFKILSSKPAKQGYRIRVATENRIEDAEEIKHKFVNQGFEVDIKRVGIELAFKNTSIDNREYWITIGNFDAKEDALSYLHKNDLPRDSHIIENIIEKAKGKIVSGDHQFSESVRIVPLKKNSLITVAEVPIGIEFHWQRKETLQYRGNIIVTFNNQGQLVAINELDIESYLASVNSSEMTTDCPLGLLEAQTVAARSTVLATMGKHHYNTDFHLCSDDHCQCYQGALREQEISVKAVNNTFGEILMYDNNVCDARYSKICGGIMEKYSNVWDDREIPYLDEGIDSDKEIEFPADTEDKAKRLIDGSPDVFCNTTVHSLPPKLANLYSTKDLFRWQVEYSREELEKLVNRKLNEDIGELVDIIPVSRGVSGRLIYLELVGSKKRITIGKELEIRRIFSESHLYSSCFYIEKTYNENKKIKSFILKGAGWGHGVGLCQVGATIMALKNYSYKDILLHYFKKSRLNKIY